MRKKKEPKFVQIAAAAGDLMFLYALDEQGVVWEYVGGVWQALKTTRREE